MAAGAPDEVAEPLALAEGEVAQPGVAGAKNEAAGPTVAASGAAAQAA